MGTFKAPRLPDDEIVARYVGGESRTMIALRCKMPDQYIKDVLQHHGVALRTPAEGKSLTAQARYVGARRRPRR